MNQLFGKSGRKMNQEFCEHLDEYGVLFERAQASYQSCLALMDSLIESPGEGNLGRTLEKSLDDWVLETRDLRNLFTKLVKKGGIVMTTPPEADKTPEPSPQTPFCLHCGFQVPKFEFSEFIFENDGQMTYRGQLLPVPEGAIA
jgi:hypothetical protein